ncbi:hypothetical protein B296_00002245 [Ensete ventricosum]|uniref:F-box domain-containing protein n=1 Tax=Ensete ventricosum TaxID=4639 RepID=A0A426Z770_ENSVE|nr:hypothetical protein B296_00002245 [Ensete ventricosum]
MGKMIVRSAAGGGELIETLPQGLVLEIMGRLDLESLCSLAPVCKALRCSVSQSFSSMSTLDLSDLSPTTWVLNRILSNNKVLQTLILDCRRLDDCSVEIFAKGSIQELVLLRCSMFSSYVFTAIADKCPKIRYGSKFTQIWLNSLGTFRNLIGLSLSRNRSSLTTFKRVNDIGILVLAEGCKRLESVRLGGFSKVTDAGYVSILHSCKNLKRLQIVNAFFLSDLAFHDLADAPNSLVEVRLISCNLITGETAESLSVCRNLQVLDFSGCKSIADTGLNSISRLSKLTTLDLCGADITDSGLSALGGGSSPIVSLCLRGCKRITDRGIVMMLRGDGVLGNTLLTLDLGYLPGVSDIALAAVAKVCRQIINLCIRNCFAVTDTSISALGSPERSEGKRSLRKLDLYNCCGLSAVSFGLLRVPFFCGLRWLGVGSTKLLAEGKARFIELGMEKPGLSICISGCEIGCKDGWQCHECI